MSLLTVAVGAAVVACGMLAASMFVDLARIHVVRTGVRRARVAVLAACRIVGSQAPRLFLLGLVFGTALALAGAALLALRGWLSGETSPSILAGVAVQQAHAFARTWLRAALVASEVELADADAEIAPPCSSCRCSVAALEERPEMLVVVQGEAGEGGLAGDERLGGGNLAPEVPGRLSAEGDGRRGDADAEEAGPGRGDRSSPMTPESVSRERGEAGRSGFTRQ